MRSWLLLLCTLQLLLGLAGFSLSPAHALSHEALPSWAMDAVGLAALEAPTPERGDSADADATDASPEFVEGLPSAAPRQASTTRASRPQELLGRHPDSVAPGRLPRPPQPLA